MSTTTTEPMNTILRMKTILREYDDGLWEIDPSCPISYTSPIIRNGEISKERLSKNLIEWLVHSMTQYRNSLSLTRDIGYQYALDFQSWFDLTKGYGYIRQTDGLIGKYRHLFDEHEKLKRDKQAVENLLAECKQQLSDNPQYSVVKEDLSDDERRTHQ